MSNRPTVELHTVNGSGAVGGVSLTVRRKNERAQNLLLWEQNSEDSDCCNVTWWTFTARKLITFCRESCHQLVLSVQTNAQSLLATMPPSICFHGKGTKTFRSCFASKQTACSQKGWQALNHKHCNYNQRIPNVTKNVSSVANYLLSSYIVLLILV